MLSQILSMANSLLHEDQLITVTNDGIVWLWAFSKDTPAAPQANVPKVAAAAGTGN